MSSDSHEADNAYLRQRLLQTAFWIVLITVLWMLDLLTKMQVRSRTGAGLDNFRLITEQVTSAIAVLVMVSFVAWWLNHFPIRKKALLSTLAGHVAGSIIFSLGHYTIQILLRKIVFALFDRVHGSPASLLSNLVFEYQKDVKIYLGIVIVITIYRMFLGGENRLRVRPNSARKILVQTGSGEAVLDYNQIDYLESARNYIVVHAGDREYLIRNTMSALLERLAVSDFIRSHRSYAVNLGKVAEIKPVDSGHVIMLTNGAEIPLSRGYRDAFRASLTG